MSNKQAIYDDPGTLAVVSKWFSNTYGDAPVESDLQGLYQSYYEYVTSPEYMFNRMDISAFVKCLVACRIIEIDGAWEHRPNYTPKRYEITRATA